MLSFETAWGIGRIKDAKWQQGICGNWLTHRDAQRLLNSPAPGTLQGKHDRALLALLLGCGPSRAEVCALTVGHIQQRDGRWCIVDLVGKYRHVRTADCGQAQLSFRLRDGATVL